jgi:membrane-associated protease RseP (regulator of RpoE activity)
VHESFDGAPQSTDEPQRFPLPPTTVSPSRIWVHIGLLVLTVVTTTFAGAVHYYGFTVGFNGAEKAAAPDFTSLAFYLRGLWYSTTVLAILGCHEMGHYLACRYYGVDVSLPFFLPSPPVLPLATGTFGAFIRIRQRIPSRVALFDIGLAGPIAGFIVAVPVLFLGLALSVTEHLPSDFQGVELGEPLLFRAASWMIWGTLPEGIVINMHPMVFAAWFGMLATALNLFPAGQLDGGHVAYAVLGRRSTQLTLATVIAAVGLTVYSTGWLVWTILLLLMIVFIGPEHPPTLDDHAPLDRTRLIMAVVGIVMLILCFTPAPLGDFPTGN